MNIKLNLKTVFASFRPALLTQTVCKNSTFYVFILFQIATGKIRTQKWSFVCLKDMWMLSSKNMHEMAGRATPDKWMDFKLALQLYRVVNNQVPVKDWVNININNIQTCRQSTFMTMKSNRLRIGMNIISNRFYYLNGRIGLDWLNQSYTTYIDDIYKVGC